MALGMKGPKETWFKYYEYNYGSYYDNTSKYYQLTTEILEYGKCEKVVDKSKCMQKAMKRLFAGNLTMLIIIDIFTLITIIIFIFRGSIYQLKKDKDKELETYDNGDGGQNNNISNVSPISDMPYYAIYIPNAQNEGPANNYYEYPEENANYNNQAQNSYIEQQNKPVSTIVSEIYYDKGVPTNNNYLFTVKPEKNYNFDYLSESSSSS